MRRNGQSSTGQTSTSQSSITRGSSSFRQVLGVFAIMIVVGVGCRTGESWAPTIPNFGGSSLAFGSRSNADIEPPSRSFQPGAGSQSAIAQRAPERGNLLAENNGSRRDPQRPPYSYDESLTATSPGNVRGTTSSSTLPLGGLPSTASPTASALGTLPSNQSLASPVGFNAPTGQTSLPPPSNSANSPRSDLSASLAGFNNSVTNSPLLPAPSQPTEQHQIRGIPGGSLGNPLGGLPPPTNINRSGPSGLPTLPPAPATGNSLPSSQARNGLPPAPGLATPGLTAPGLPSTNLAPALTGTTSPNEFRPGTLASPNPVPNSPSPSLPSPSIPGLGAPNQAASNATLDRAPGSGSGGLGTPLMQPVPPTSNYPQTQHGHYPGLPSWPGSATGPSYSPANPAPDANRQNIPGIQTMPATIPAPGGMAPGGMAPGGAAPSGVAPTPGGPSALPSFPGFSSIPTGDSNARTEGETRIAQRVIPGMICDGDRCYIQ